MHYTKSDILIQGAIAPMVIINNRRGKTKYVALQIKYYTIID